MDIRNKRSAVLFPLVIAFTLVIGIYVGVKLNKSGISERLLIYPRVDKVVSVLNIIEDSYVDTVSRKMLERTAIDAILQKLDPHSIYIPAEELQAMNEPLEGNFTGIGVQFNSQDDTVIVVSTVAGGPSEKVGIRAGDRIVKVNDTIVAGMKLKTNDIVKRLRGEKGSMVKVTMKRPGTLKLIDFKVVRNAIPIYSIDVSYLIAHKTGYLRINKFSKTTHDEFVAAVKKLHKLGAKKLIIDLRENGGGLLETAIEIADELLDDKKLIVYTQGRARARSNSYSTPGGLCVNDSLVILINENSASASEILAGAIQDNDRGCIIGRRSFGKGLVQEPTPLPDGDALRLTIARYYTPTGRCIQKSYKDGKDNYYDEVHKRLLHGEMEQQDSIKFSDSLKYITPGGRIVYGGGGIMPDVFVPADTSFYSKFYLQVYEKGLVYKYAFWYSDANRKKLSKFRNYRSMISFLNKEKILQKFLKFVEDHDVKVNNTDLKISSKYLEVQLQAYIVRNFFDNTGFYPIINTIDVTVQKALETCNTSK